MAGEKLTRQSLVESATPEMAPLLGAGWDFLLKNKGGIGIELAKNPDLGVSRLEFNSKAAQKMSRAFWDSKAPPGGSHVEATKRLLTSDVLDELGYQAELGPSEQCQDGFTYTWLTYRKSKPRLSKKK